MNDQDIQILAEVQGVVRELHQLMLELIPKLISFSKKSIKCRVTFYSEGAAAVVNRAEIDVSISREQREAIRLIADTACSSRKAVLERAEKALFEVEQKMTMAVRAAHRAELSLEDGLQLKPIYRDAMEAIKVISSRAGTAASAINKPLLEAVWLEREPLAQKLRTELEAEAESIEKFFNAKLEELPKKLGPETQKPASADVERMLLLWGNQIKNMFSTLDVLYGK